MRAGELLRQARRDAGFTQRELAKRTGIAQPTIARIEVGTSDARVETLDRLLSSCGYSLHSERRAGYGVDRTQIRDLLRMSPRERLELLTADAAGLRRLESAVTR